MACPGLPAELWARILENIPEEDNTFLWTTCRRVNRTIRAEAERIFRRDRIPKVVLRWTMHRDPASWRITGRFRGFSPDHTRVEFTLTEQLINYDGNPRHTPRLNYQGFAYMLQRGDYLPDPRTSYRGEFVWPAAVIQIGTLFNDTEMPAFSISHDMEYVSFDWRGMCNKFFREEELVERLKTANSPRALSLPDKYPIRIEEGEYSRWLRDTDDDSVLYSDARKMRFRKYHERYYGDFLDSSGYFNSESRAVLSYRYLIGLDGCIRAAMTGVPPILRIHKRRAVFDKLVQDRQLTRINVNGYYEYVEDVNHEIKTRGLVPTTHLLRLSFECPSYRQQGFLASVRPAPPPPIISFSEGKPDAVCDAIQSLKEGAMRKAERGDKWRPGMN